MPLNAACVTLKAVLVSSSFFSAEIFGAAAPGQGLGLGLGLGLGVGVGVGFGAGSG